MHNTLIRGDNLSTLASAVMEHIRPGQRVDLTVGLRQEVGQEALDTLATTLNRGGLTAAVEFGSTAEWEKAVRIQFIRPRQRAGVSVLPLVVLLVGALGVVAVGGIVGFKLGNVLDSVAKNLPWIILATGGTIVALALIREAGRRRETRASR